MSRVTLEQIFKLAGRGDTFVLSPEIMPRVPLALGDRPNIRTAVDAVIATSALLKEYLRNTYDPGSPRVQNLVDMFCDHGLTAAVDGFEGGFDILTFHHTMDLLKYKVWPYFEKLWPLAPHVYVGFKGPGSFKFGVYVDFERLAIDRLTPVKKIMVRSVPASRRAPPPIRS